MTTSVNSRLDRILRRQDNPTLFSVFAVSAVMAFVAAIRPVEMPLRRQGYRVEEAARILGLGRTMVYELIKSGQIRIVKVGTRTIVPQSEIDRILLGED